MNGIESVRLLSGVEKPRPHVVHYRPQPVIVNALAIDSRHIPAGRGVSHDALDRHQIVGTFADRLKCPSQVVERPALDPRLVEYPLRFLVNPIPPVLASVAFPPGPDEQQARICRGFRFRPVRQYHLDCFGRFRPKRYPSGNRGLGARPVEPARFKEASSPESTSNRLCVRK